VRIDLVLEGLQLHLPFFALLVEEAGEQFLDLHDHVV